MAASQPFAALHQPEMPIVVVERFPVGHRDTIFAGGCEKSALRKSTRICYASHGGQHASDKLPCASAICQNAELKTK